MFPFFCAKIDHVAIASNNAKLPPFESTAVRPTPCLCSISFGVKGGRRYCLVKFVMLHINNESVATRVERCCWEMIGPSLLCYVCLAGQCELYQASSGWGEGVRGGGSREGMGQVMSVFVSLSCPWRTLSLDKQGRGRRPQQPASCQAYLTLTFDLVILTLGQLLHLIDIKHVCKYHLYLIIG